jgi:hypothetical protein
VKLALAFCFLAVATWRLAAEEVTPVGAGLREESELWVTCAFTTALRPGEIALLPTRADCDSATGVYHYKLWVPHGYIAQPQRRWPCVFVASPFGNAEMGNMAARLKPNHVVVLLVESRNGPWPPVIGNFLAAHDDVVRRIRIEEGAKIATGLSGGARASSIFVQLRPGFAGAILQGAGVARGSNAAYYFNHLARNPSLLFALTIGNSDPRRSEISELQQQVDTNHLAVLVFPGGHQWAPPEIFSKALDWIESRAR